MINFYLPTNHDTGRFSTEGGTINLNKLMRGDYHELFSHMTLTGEYASGIQYRKVFIRNDSPVILTGIRIWLESASGNPGYSLAKEASLGDSITATTGTMTSTFLPYSGAYQSGLNVGILYPYAQTGIWVKQTFNQYTGSVDFATFRLYAGWK